MFKFQPRLQLSVIMLYISSLSNINERARARAYLHNYLQCNFQTNYVQFKCNFAHIINCRARYIFFYILQ